MQYPSSGGWNQAIGPDPKPGDDLRDIAYFVRDVLCDVHEREPTRNEIRAFCEASGFSYSHVIGAMRRQDLARNADTLHGDTGHDDDYKRSTSGITVNVARLDELMGDLKPRCPYRIRFVNTWTFQPIGITMPCGSWCCADCGLSHAEDLLQAVRMRIVNLDEVYFAEAQWEPGLAARMARRRSDKNLNMFWYHRIDDKVFYLADKPINGTSAPTSCLPLTPTDAVAVLVRDVLWVPGHVAHGFSKAWDSPSAGGSGGAGDLVSVAGLNDHEVIEVMKTFVRDVELRYNIRVDCGDAPRQYHDDLVEMLKGLINEARTSPNPDTGAPHG